MYPEKHSKPNLRGIDNFKPARVQTYITTLEHENKLL